MPSSADGDEALLRQAAERARALIKGLSGDAESLRQHQPKDASLAEGVDLCERASHDAAQLLKLLEEALHRRGGNPAISPPSPESNSQQEPS